MAQSSGTSVRGLQSLYADIGVPYTKVSILIAGQVLPPPERVGYFYLYQFLSSGSQPHFIVEKGVILRPGIFQPIRLPLLDNTWGFKLLASWNGQGIPWTATLI